MRIQRVHYLTFLSKSEAHRIGDNICNLKNYAKANNFPYTGTRQNKSYGLILPVRSIDHHIEFTVEMRLFSNISRVMSNILVRTKK